METLGIVLAITGMISLVTSIGIGETTRMNAEASKQEAPAGAAASPSKGKIP